MSLWVDWSFIDILDHFEEAPCEVFADREVGFDEIRAFWGAEDGDHVGRCWRRTFERQRQLTFTLRRMLDGVLLRYDEPAEYVSHDLTRVAGRFPKRWPFPGTCACWVPGEHPTWGLDCLRATNAHTFEVMKGCSESCGDFGLADIANLIDMIDFHQKSDYDKLIRDNEILIKKGRLRHEFAGVSE